MLIIKVYKYNEYSTNFKTIRMSGIMRQYCNYKLSQSGVNNKC